MAGEATERTPGEQTSFLNDPRVRNWLYQIVVAVAIVAFAAFIARNTATNLVNQHKTTGFDFFFQTSGFDILFSLIPYGRGSYYWEAFLVGLLNTLLVSAIGIVFATILGFAVGIARLSGNWLVARIATVYVETLRNIPLLLQLVFWYFAVLKAMPSVRESYVFFGSALNQRGLFMPRPLFDDRFGFVLIALAVALVAIVVFRRWARRQLETRGRRLPVFWSGLGILVVVVAGGWLISGTHVDFEIPEIKGFNYAGGLALPPEFVALSLGLILYTATFISEIVRAGILSVSHGQTEAAQALGLKDGDRLRLVIIPQAMRVIVPPLTSQYLNLTKNSSLAVAIGYPELVSVFMGTTLNQTGRAIEVVFITMLVYLVISILTSLFMNWYNARVALVER
jgi:general L-amino acid transport system permease protein